MRYVADCDICVKPIRPGEPLYRFDLGGKSIKICKVCLKDLRRKKQ